jgi:methylisocitrate lyase
VVPIDEQLVRLAAALKARRDPDFLIIARSDADVVGYDELVLRCNRYLEAGADIAMPICFVVDGRSVTALSPDDQMEIYARLARDIDGPVKGVLIPQGYTAADMADIGYRVMGLSGGPIEAVANALHLALGDLRRTGSEATYRTATSPEIAAPGGIMQLLRIDEFLGFENDVLDRER